MYNEIYDPAYVTHGNLPEVVNDFRNAKQTVKMLGIPAENTIELKDASHRQLTRSWDLLQARIFALTRQMTGKTGILGPSPAHLVNGFEWDKIKPFAMKINKTFDHLDIDLSS